MKLALAFALCALTAAPCAAAPLAPPPSAADYCLRLDSQTVQCGTHGLVVRGRVTNTGRLPLTYTQVLPLLRDGAGREVFRGSGYLTASPLLPGASAEFRVCEANAPKFSRLTVAFREAGHPVMLQTPTLLQARKAQTARRTAAE